MRPHFFSLWWVTFRTWTGCTWNWSGLHPEKEAGSLKVYVSLYLQMVMTSSQTLSSCSCMTKKKKNTLMQVYLLILAKHTWTLLAGDQTYCITNKMLNFWSAGLALSKVARWWGWAKISFQPFFERLVMVPTFRLNAELLPFTFTEKQNKICRNICIVSVLTAVTFCG